PVSPGRYGSANRADQPSAVQACSVPATWATWSSWIRVRCQTSQAIELPCPAGRNASCSSVSPPVTSCTTPRIRLNASASRSPMVIPLLASALSAARLPGLLDQQAAGLGQAGPVPGHAGPRVTGLLQVGQAGIDVAHGEAARGERIVLDLGPVQWGGDRRARPGAYRVGRGRGLR